VGIERNQALTPRGTKKDSHQKTRVEIPEKRKERGKHRRCSMFSSNLKYDNKEEGGAQGGEGENQRKSN